MKSSFSWSRALCPKSCKPTKSKIIKQKKEKKKREAKKEKMRVFID